MATMDTIANEALRLMEEPSVNSIQDNVYAARQLKAAFFDASKWCIERADWNFASVRTQLQQLATIPVYGYLYLYGKPADWMRTIRVTDFPQVDDTDNEFLLWGDEQGAIATSATAVWMRYISNKWVMARLGDWSQSYADFVAAELAFRCSPSITRNQTITDRIFKTRDMRKTDAKSFDAVSNPAKPLPRGRWGIARLRGGFRGGYRGE